MILILPVIHYTSAIPILSVTCHTSVILILSVTHCTSLILIPSVTFHTPAILILSVTHHLCHLSWPSYNSASCWQHGKVRKDQAVTVHHASVQKGQKRKPLTPEENYIFSEHATSLCKSYSDAFRKLQAEFRSQSLRGECFLCCCVVVNWFTLNTLQRLKEPVSNVSVRCESKKFSDIEICLLLSELFRIYCKRMYLW